MTDQFRAMCAELVDALENARRIIEGADGTLHINTAEFVLRRAHDLLEQPERRRPTDEEIYNLFDWLLDEWQSNNEGEFPLPLFTRAALAKWGRQ